MGIHDILTTLHNIAQNLLPFVKSPSAGVETARKSGPSKGSGIPDDDLYLVHQVRAERGKAREMRRVPSAKGNLSAKADLESGVTGLSE